MNTKIYWGEKGTYGPFSVQDDGWPNAGEVVRHYRLTAKMSLADLARAYGAATGTTVSKQWISLMERHNEVPNDITRRQALVKILHIPPILLGLATLEVALPEKDEEQRRRRAPVVLKQKPLHDVSSEETKIKAFWLLNETSHAHQVLEDIIRAIRQLEIQEKRSSGAFQTHLQKLLYSHYRLASRIHRDLLNLPTAYHYANLAVRVTKQLNEVDLIAVSLFVRGFIRLIWSLHGDKSGYGVFHFSPEKAKEALQDFEQALPLARPQLKGLLLLETSRVQALLSTSAIDTTIALKTMDLAGKHVNSETRSSDPYTNILYDARVKGLDEEEYLLGRMITFNATGQCAHALEEGETLDRLDEKKRRSKDQTRHYAWLEIVQAQTYLGLKEYPIALEKGRNAFLTLRDLDSLDNIAFLWEISHRLHRSSYQNHPDVQKLEKLLTTYDTMPRSHFS